MSIDPPSFDQQLAYKLTQAPTPTYDPAHWDQLEDQLQHLNQHLQAQHTAAPAGPSAPATTSLSTAGGWLAGPLAKLGFVAALAGLTATNAWLISRTPAPTEPRAVAAPPAPTGSTADLPPTAPQPAMPVTAAPVPAPIRQSVRLVPDAAAAALSPTVVAPAPAAASVSLNTLPELAPAAGGNDAASGTDANDLTRDLARPTTSPREGIRPDSSTTVARPTTSETVANFERLSHEVANIITPNGDGRNDAFELPFAPGTYRLTIYDSRGRVVLDRPAYDNTWDATGLPAGPYLYTIRPDAAPQWRLSGTLTVQR